MTTTDFMYPMVQKIKQLTDHGMRHGQACFNALHEYFPDVANEIRGTKYDPYYFEDDDRRFGAFWSHVYARIIKIK